MVKSIETHILGVDGFDHRWPNLQPYGMIEFSLNALKLQLMYGAFTLDVN